MATIVTNLDALVGKLYATIDNVLSNEIMDASVKVAQIMGEVYVYGAYGSNSTGQPNMYVRRGDANGGLTDKESFTQAIAPRGTLDIRNIAKPNPDFPGRQKVKNLAQLVELGDGNGGRYSYKKGEDTFGDFHDPRPFMETAQKEMGAGNTLANLMKAGLKKRGLTVG